MDGQDNLPGELGLGHTVLMSQHIIILEDFCGQSVEKDISLVFLGPVPCPRRTSSLVNSLTIALIVDPDANMILLMNILPPKGKEMEEK